MDQVDPRLAEVIGAAQKLGAEIDQDFRLIEGKPMAVLTIKSNEIMFPQPINIEKMIESLEAENERETERHKVQTDEIKNKIKQLKALKEKQAKDK